MKKRQTLAEKFPELAKQWHPTKNGALKPTDVPCGYGKKVWWLLPYDDPETGKHFDFEWEASVCNRTKGRGCPYLCGRAVWPGFNDLATKEPELAKQWHSTKNGALKPTDVSCGCGKKVWWLLSYDDPETGKHFDFEWEAAIASRVKGANCPFLTGQAVWPGFNDLATKDPELTKQWHPTKNGALKPTDVSCGYGKKVRWLFPYDDPKTGKRFDFEWEESVCLRTRGYGCPYLSGKAVWPGFNDLATKDPGLAKQWHPTKNGDLKPTDVTYGKDKKVWWLLSYDDPETSKHFDFEWENNIFARVQGKGCPYLSGHAVWPGFNDLATKDPELAKQWHPTKNGALKPTDVSCGCVKKVWWLFPYDDPETGKHFDFEWEAAIASRIKGANCPFLTGQAVWPGFNDLATKDPKLAKQWHPTKNGGLKPTDVSCGYGKKVWWLFPYDDPKTGKHFDFEWEKSPNARKANRCCPFLCNKAVWPGYNDFESNYSELAKQWHPTKNKDLRPSDITSGHGKKVWWFLPYDDPDTGKHFDFEWQAQPNARVMSSGCPFLSGKAVWPGYNDFASNYPELAKEWHPTKNRKCLPNRVYMNDTSKYWWLCKDCGHAWRSSVRARTCDEKKCPKCKRAEGAQE